MKRNITEICKKCKRRFEELSRLYGISDPRLIKERLLEYHDNDHVAIFSKVKE